MLLADAREEYLVYRHTAGYTKNTVQVDKIALYRLQKIVGNIEVQSITHRHIDGVYVMMSEKKLRASTVNVATACMRSFFAWARDRGYAAPDANPVSGRRYRPREALNLIRVPLAQFPSLLDAARTPRDRMLIALGLYTMGRKTEITGIRMQHLDMDSEEIQMYISKANTFDRMPMSKELRREITRWLPIYEAEVGPLREDWYLVPAVQGGHRKGQTGYPMRPWKEMASPEDAVTYALAQIGISGYRTGMHVLRRSSARARFDEMVNLGYDGALRRVSAWLHHSSVIMTERYLGLDLDRAQRDEETKGEFMFPSLEGDNVVALRKDAHGEGNVVGL